MKVKKINGKINGTIFLDKIEFDKIRTATIGANNKTSGKINFPSDEIGQTVYILYPKQEAESRDEKH